MYLTVFGKSRLECAANYLLMTIYLLLCLGLEVLYLVRNPLKAVYLADFIVSKVLSSGIIYFLASWYDNFYILVDDL